MKREDIIRLSYAKECFAVVIRHSVREIITDARQSLYQLLTPVGKELARNFGTKLPKTKPIRLYHSHVERCKETAECIRESFKGQVHSLSCHDLLTGFYVFDPEPILGDVNECGNFQFISNWFKGLYSETHIMNPYTARQKMLNAFKHNYNENYLDIYISHDWNIALLSSIYYDINKHNYPWPGFMHGILLEHNENQFLFSCDPDKKVII